MILLDTNAVLWALSGHRRAQPLTRGGERLYLSPVSLLELAYLIELDKLRPTEPEPLARIAADPRWTLDSPPSDRLFGAALDLDWTRDPFDRLLVAHASYRRWRLATGDRKLLERLPPDRAVAL